MPEREPCNREAVTDLAVEGLGAPENPNRAIAAALLIGSYSGADALEAARRVDELIQGTGDV